MASRDKRRRVWRPLGVLTMAPWRRAPLLLLRRVGVAAALLAAGAVATLPAAAAIPFLSAARSATLHHQIDATCSWYAGVTVNSQIGVFGVYYAPWLDEPEPEYDFVGGVQRRSTAIAATAATVTELGPAETTLISPLMNGPTENPEYHDYPMFAVYRDNAQEHLELVSGSWSAGAWLPDRYADFVGLKVGDGMFFSGSRTSVPVTAIYRSLREQPDQPWWCDLRPTYDQPPGNRPAPETIFLDKQSFLTTLEPATVGASAYRIAFPLTDANLDLDRAHRAADQLAAARDGLLQPTRDDPLNDNRGYIFSRLPTFVARADLTRESLLHTVAPISAAGVLVGVVVVGAAATYWVQRRRQELTMLAAHGVGPRALALKAVGESWPALLAGAAAGWAGAWLLVRWAGPDPVLSAEALPWGLIGAGATLLLEILTVFVVAGSACRSLTDQVPVRHGRFLRSLPYELLILAAAPLAWRWLGGNRVSEDEPGVGVVIHVPGRLLVVPIMVVAGLTILIARLTVGYLRRRSRKPAPKAPAAFLGWRRLGRQAVMAAVLAGATATPVALAAYGAAVTGSVRTTIADEAKLLIGTDVVVSLNESAPVPASLNDQATMVLRLEQTVIGGVTTNLVAIDPQTFARGTYWNDDLSGSLDDVLAELGSGEQSPVTVVAYRKTPAGMQRATAFSRDALGGTVRVVSTRWLPSQRAGYSLALIPQPALGDLTEYARPELWIRGDPAQILPKLAEAHLPIRKIFVAQDIYGNTLWEPLTFTFEYLTALSMLTGVVTLVGVLLFLESQAPQRRRAWVLLRRMGLSAGSHRRALYGELALPLLAGLLGGVAVAAGLVAALSSTFDVNPTTLPDTVIDPPYEVVGIIAVMTFVIAVAAVIYAQARIRRAKASEVLRDAI